MKEFLIIFIVNAIRVLKYAILVRVLLSWFQSAYPGKITTMIYEVTEPVLRLFRSFLPRTGMIDLAPLVAFFVLDLAQVGVISLLGSL